MGLPVVFFLLADDWTSFYGNLPKLFLGMTSIVFDIMLLVQHHIIYAGNRDYSDLNQGKRQRFDSY